MLNSEKKILKSFLLSLKLKLLHLFGSRRFEGEVVVVSFMLYLYQRHCAMKMHVNCDTITMEKIAKLIKFN